MTTIHALQRAKERQGYNSKAALNQMIRALEKGKTAKDYSSKERKWLEKYTESHPGTIARTYDGFCFLFEKDLCITLFPLPKWFYKKKRYDGKEKIRDAKKYTKYHQESYVMNYDVEYVA